MKKEDRIESDESESPNHVRKGKRLDGDPTIKNSKKRNIRNGNKVDKLSKNISSSQGIYHL